MKKSQITTILAGMALASAASLAHATAFTSTSPTGLDVTTVGASTVGGIVFDAVGTNTNEVVSQTAASSLFIGFADTGSPTAYQGNPFTIGIQTGFDSSITSQLGGGLTGLAIRFTLFDGDSAAGNFDDNGDLTLLVNGIAAGVWDGVNAENTDGLGAAGGAGFSGGGFRDNLLDTGWFYISDATTLQNIFDSIVATEQVVFQIQDVDPYDNYYDFTQGIDASLIDVGQGPGVIPGEPGNNVPEPGTLALLGLGAFAAAVRRKKA
ncbi:PEP-CTERM sorting domain-containing protein [Nitrogeniibacter mangrovi]|uniref:PEP-CTERM sorting domain-containing protein n=1 Tax=Nitrogeniibacter mangrovi TaxID=2016596 RepID=A0A6C1B3E3_9RHOO|nr:PEP-CTERM sorting domain-containing protein [Nitrogeniibacter mangrovi]QID16850.1 PEP-CTERM sorting domain-containing protein [Nitrogeniibacter mangrovi]